MSTQTQTPAINAQELTDDQLEQLLKERKEAKRKAYERERKAYERARDTEVEVLITEALQLSQRLTEFKTRCHDILQRQEVKLQDYGEIRSNSKGGFSLTHSDGIRRVTRRRDTEPSWDERGQKGLDLIKDFLHSSIKKRDKDMFELLMSFLERNKSGDLEYGRVFSLLAHRNVFNDPRWLEGLNLLEQSFSTHFRGYGYEFKTKTSEGGWENIAINFSAL